MFFTCVMGDSSSRNFRSSGSSIFPNSIRSVAFCLGRAFSNAVTQFETPDHSTPARNRSGNCVSAAIVR